MSNYIIAMPTVTFTALRSFKALPNGKIYIGKPDTDPLKPVNQIPVYVVNESGVEIQIAQPIIINSGGFPVYNGQSSKFITKQNYSMAVYDQANVQQHYWPDLSKIDPDALRQELSSSDGSTMIGIGESNLYREAFFVSPEMYGAAPSKSPADTAAVLAAFSAAKTMGLSVKLSRRYDCLSNITLTNFISEVWGLGQGLSGIDFGSGFGFVIDNSGLCISRKPVKFSSLTICAGGVKTGVAIDFTGIRNVRYGPQLEVRSVTVASRDDSETTFNTAFKLKAAGEAIFDYVTVSGITSNRMPRIFDLHSTKDLNVTNGSYSDFEIFMDAHDDTEGISISLNHIIAGHRGVVSQNNVGNFFAIIGNHFNTSLSAVELGEGTVNGGNHCTISDNFCIVFNAAEHATTPYIGFDVCSSYNVLTGNQVLITGFSKDSTHTRLRPNTAGIRVPADNTISNPISNAISRGVIIAAGANNNQVYGNKRIGMTLGNDIIDNGTNTRFWLLDSDTNAFMTSDIKLDKPGYAGVRQIRAHTGTDTNVASGIIRFIGGASGVEHDAILEITCRETATKSLRPSTSNTYNCGESGAPWAGGFTQTAFTVTSDERAKTDPLDISDAVLDAWAEVNWRQYKLLDRVALKGDAARWHHGVIAQRVVEAFARHGLDACDYGLLCHDKWEAQEEIAITHESTSDLFNEEGELIRAGREEYKEVITPARDAGDGYSIRYEEAFALEAELQRRNYERLAKRVEALEEAKS